MRAHHGNHPSSSRSSSSEKTPAGWVQDSELAAGLHSNRGWNRSTEPSDVRDLHRGSIHPAPILVTVDLRRLRFGAVRGTLCIPPPRVSLACADCGCRDRLLLNPGVAHIQRSPLARMAIGRPDPRFRLPPWLDESIEVFSRIAREGPATAPSAKGFGLDLSSPIANNTIPATKPVTGASTARLARRASAKRTDDARVTGPACPKYGGTTGPYRRDALLTRCWACCSGTSLLSLAQSRRSKPTL